jgi:cell division protein ZapA
MSGKLKPVTLHILDKDYVVACPGNECADLLAAADYLSRKMKEVREKGKVTGSERLLVMTALNVAHELLASKPEKNRYTEDIGADLQRLETKIQFALEQSRV